MLGIIAKRRMVLGLRGDDKENVNDKIKLQGELGKHLWVYERAMNLLAPPQTNTAVVSSQVGRCGCVGG